MLVPDANSAFYILKRTIEQDVKNDLFNVIVDEQVEILRGRLAVELKPIIEAITFDRVDTFVDLMRMRDEYVVAIKINDDKFKIKEGNNK